MTSTTSRRAAVALSVLVLVAAGCGTGPRAGTTSKTPAGPDGNVATKDIGQSAGAPAERSAIQSGAGAAGNSTTTAGGTAAGTPTGPLVGGRALVVTGTLEVRTDDAGKAARDAAAIVRTLGGIISGEDASDNYATLTVRIRPDKYDDAVTRLAKLGTELHRSTSTTDVTDQVVDVASRVKSQQASVERVRALLARATTLGEVVQVEGELARREADLESLQARLRALAAQTDLATLTLTLTEKDHAATPGSRRGFLAGLSQGWRAFTGAGAVLLTGLGRTLPFVALLLVLLAAAQFVRRNRHRSAKPPTAVE